MSMKSGINAVLEVVHPKIHNFLFFFNGHWSTCLNQQGQSSFI